jgi:two-component system LytT family response regulator
VLLVDDEPAARRGLRRQLAGLPDLEVVGECEDGEATVAAIPELRPDLVFLDIQMPGLDGFGVIEAVGLAHMPAVVLVTAYDEFALRAFEVHAMDYLLKPVDERRLRDAVERARARPPAPARVRPRPPGPARARRWSGFTAGSSPGGAWLARPAALVPAAGDPRNRPGVAAGRRRHRPNRARRQLCPGPLGAQVLRRAEN